ncbi:efflux transporter outer membrane subunit [Desulfovibrio sp. OttesenSCG-928-A18]|nr:efflux transporter outer membrane subunit [Desulfovibrio sp. OttesenSCG-928-A18]
MPKFRHSVITTVLCLVLFAQGCTMAPKYERPGMPVPRDYARGGGLHGSPAQVPVWRQFFRDPGMQLLIETALANNRDLRIAMLNIEKVRAQYRIQRADLLPTVAAAASSSAQRVPREMSMTGLPYIERQYSASLGFSAFELDLFGRIRSLSEAALETYYSVENDAQTAQIALVAEVAGVYLQLIADRELLDITRATYKNRKGQYELVANKFRSGVASQLEVSQAKSIMEEARSNVARYATSVGQAENYLSLLLGAPLPAGLPDIRKLSRVEMLADIPEGLPSSLLERRPDIQAAEHRLKAANANIGAARANFFPTIALTGALGTLSNESSQLFASGSGFWSFLPQVSLPIFDTGRNIARLEMSEADRDIAVADYERTIQGAFREVADTLVQRQHIGEQMAAETALLQSTTQAYNLASARYEVGVDSYLNVLDAQRSLYSAQQSHISTKLLRETNAITLFKALGGGWQ